MSKEKRFVSFSPGGWECKGLCLVRAFLLVGRVPQCCRVSCGETELLPQRKLTFITKPLPQ